MIIVGFVSGGCFCLIGIIAQENYGTKRIAKVIGYLMTGAAVGIFVFEMVIFEILYSQFAS